MNRKWIALLLCCSIVLMFASACGRNRNDVTEPNNGVNDNMNNSGNNANNGNSANSNTNGNSNGNENTNTPGNMIPGNDNGNQMSGSNMNESDGTYPTFPNSLATMDADVAVRDLFDTLGLTETDLDNAMRDIATVGDGVYGARTYRHKLLGEEADVSYGFDDQKTINKVTVNAKPTTVDKWRSELTDTLGAKEIEGQTDSWTYDDNQIKIDDQGTHVVITIEKKA